MEAVRRLVVDPGPRFKQYVCKTFLEVIDLLLFICWQLSVTVIHLQEAMLDFFVNLY